MMSFPTPLPPLFPHLQLNISRPDTDKDQSRPQTTSTSPPQNQNQRQRGNSQDNKFTTELEREELALQERVINPFCSLMFIYRMFE
jgi:hypothetical protein